MAPDDDRAAERTHAIFAALRHTAENLTLDVVDRVERAIRGLDHGDLAPNPEHVARLTVAEIARMLFRGFTSLGSTADDHTDDSGSTHGH